MTEELVAPKLTGFAPPPASATAAYFKHIGECNDCRTLADGLCAEGAALLDHAALIPAID